MMKMMMNGDPYHSVLNGRMLPMLYLWNGVPWKKEYSVPNVNLNYRLNLMYVVLLRDPTLRIKSYDYDDGSRMSHAIERDSKEYRRLKRDYLINYYWYSRYSIPVNHPMVDLYRMIHYS